MFEAMCRAIASHTKQLWCKSTRGIGDEEFLVAVLINCIFYLESETSDLAFIGLAMSIRHFQTKTCALG